MAKTSPQLTEAEQAVAAEAVETVIVADIPSFERGMIPQATLTKAVNAAVAAIDNLRDKLATAQGAKT